MAQEPNTEQRLASLEKEVAELKLQRSIQETRDYALLARIDSFIETQSRAERSQLRGFEQVFAAQKQQANRMDNLEAGQHNLERAVIEVVDTLKNHKTSIETLAGQMNNLAGQVNELAAGQQQLIALLTGGKSPLND